MKNIVLLFGGDSCEHDVSVITALSVYNSIKEICRILPIYVKNGTFYLCKKSLKINKIRNFSQKNFSEVAFASGGMSMLSRKKKKIPIFCAVNCCHGGCGENGALAGLLENARIPQTSPGVYQSALFMDKVFTKYFLEKKKISVVPYRVVSKDDYDVAKELGFPLIVKPARQGSSIGIGVVENEDKLPDAIDLAASFDDKIIVEKALVGFTELNCAAYRKGKVVIVSEIEKIVSDKKYYDFDSKYVKNDVSREIPANIDEKITDRIKNITKSLYVSSELKGVVRVDFLLSATGKLYVNEVNTVPGSLAFYLFKGMGGFRRIVFDTIAEARRQFEEREKLITDFSGNVLDNFDESKLDAGVKK